MDTNSVWVRGKVTLKSLVFRVTSYPDFFICLRKIPNLTLSPSFFSIDLNVNFLTSLPDIRFSFRLISLLSISFSRCTVGRENCNRKTDCQPRNYTPSGFTDVPKVTGVKIPITTLGGKTPKVLTTFVNVISFVGL